MKNKSLLWIRYSLFLAAIGLLIVGYIREEHLEVMQKAVKICLECIGIG
ncbi:MAG: hypothetical protein HFI12_00095 [Lachnospiraceae bacterium]|nr:hypothetical protein [Lachnospiraceae bacterium]